MSSKTIKKTIFYITLLFICLVYITIAKADEINNSQIVPYKECHGGVAINGLFNYWHTDDNSPQDQLVKTLTNNSCSTPKYFLVKVYKVTHPLSKEKDKLLTLKDMTQSLMVYPNHLVVLPKHSVNIIFSLPNGRPKDLGFYRVAFLPVIPEKEYGFNISHKQLEKIRARASVGIGLSTALVIEPKSVKYSYRIKRDQGKVKIKNTGNGVIIAETFDKCISDHLPEKSCKYRKNTRSYIYPGLQEQFNLANYRDQLSLSLELGQTRKMMSYRVVK
ncbi:hypothetical protein [Dongshaea marina]|uniref:hypothetical protein n=1 Tax=Dongshaea marina TaxID=2047966 RepID=UPI000D3ED189|nr:hypothetical protein [Dongshaea marina]